MKNQYTITITLEPLSQDESESTHLKLSANCLYQSIKKILNSTGDNAQTLLSYYKKVTMELKQN